MNKKLLLEHYALLSLIFTLDGSIRHEYLSKIILDTNYNDIKSKSACSRLFTKLKKAKILNEMIDYDHKKRFYLNKPAFAYLKGVDATKTSAVSTKTTTLVKSNFKACYFIENYLNKYKNLGLEKMVDLASKSIGNLFNMHDETALNRIAKAFDHSLTEDAMDKIYHEYNSELSSREKQLESLKLGPEARKKKAKLKANNVDVDEEFYGDPVPGEVTPQKTKKEKQKQKVVSLKNLKQNNVYLSDIEMKDVKVKTALSYSVSSKQRGTTRFSTQFNNLQTKQVTLKFVYFCSAKELKTSKMLSLYDDVKSYANSLQVNDVVMETVIKFVKKNQELLSRYDSNALSHIFSEKIPFGSHQVVKIVTELDVIFINEINYKRSIKKLAKHKNLKDEINPVNYTVSHDSRIRFRHYDFYPTNEHDPN